MRALIDSFTCGLSETEAARPEFPVLHLPVRKGSSISNARRLLSLGASLPRHPPMTWVVRFGALRLKYCYLSTWELPRRYHCVVYLKGRGSLPVYKSRFLLSHKILNSPNRAYSKESYTVTLTGWAILHVAWQLFLTSPSAFSADSLLEIISLTSSTLSVTENGLLFRLSSTGRLSE